MVAGPRILGEVSFFRASFVLLIAGIILASCGGRFRADEHVSPELQPYIPGSARVLAGCNLLALKQSKLIARHPEILQRIPLDGRAALLGLDPRQNLQDALFVWRTDPNDSLLLVHGTFSAALLEPRLRNLGARREMNTSGLLYATPKGSVLFPKDDVAVLGLRTAVVPSEMILLRKGGGAGIPGPIEELLRKAPDTEQIWLATASPIELGGFHLREEISSALGNFTSSIQTASMGVSVTDGVQYRADLECVSDAGAVRVRDALRGALALAHIGTDKNPLVKQVLDLMRVQQSGKAVHVEARISSQLAEELFTALPHS